MPPASKKSKVKASSRKIRHTCILSAYDATSKVEYRPVPKMRSRKSASCVHIACRLAGTKAPRTGIECQWAKFDSSKPDPGTRSRSPMVEGVKRGRTRKHEVASRWASILDWVVLEDSHGGSAISPPLQSSFARIADFLSTSSFLFSSVRSCHSFDSMPRPVLVPLWWVNP